MLWHFPPSEVEHVNALILHPPHVGIRSQENPYFDPHENFHTVVSVSEVFRARHKIRLGKILV